MNITDGIYVQIFICIYMVCIIIEYHIWYIYIYSISTLNSIQINTIQYHVFLQYIYILKYCNS